MEEKLSKVIAEVSRLACPFEPASVLIPIQKAKTESKYHAIARAKESSESERKQLSRANEKQLKLIDMHEEREKKLNSQLVSAVSLVIRHAAYAERCVCGWQGAAEKELSKMKAFCTQWESVDRRRKGELEDAQNRATAEKTAYSKVSSTHSSETVLF